MLYKPSRVERDPGQVLISGQPLQSVHNFTYLGSTGDAKLDMELETRIARASSTVEVFEETSIDSKQ